MHKTILILTLGLLATIVKAQDSQLLNYEWEENPRIHTLSDEEAKESYVYIKHTLGSEIFYLDNRNAIEYYMEHVIKRLNDEESIDNNNKVYLPGSQADPNNYTIIESARVIKSNGTILDLDIADILEEENEEDGNIYRFFALEGLEPGDEVEYLYIYPRTPLTTGKLYWMQSSVFKREITLLNITPKNLINKFKSYNSFPNMVRDSSQEDVNFYSAIGQNIKGIKEEKFAHVSPNKACVAYYLYKNTASSSSIDNYSNVSKYLARIINETNVKKTGVSKFIKKMEINEDWSDEDKIRHIENYIKKEIRYVKSGVDGLGNLSSITSKRLANESGLIKLYATIFNELGIKYEIVYTTDRTDLVFDKDFECGIFLTDALIYFPKLSKYLCPSELQSRYGFPPARFTDNYGYFTRFIDVGGSKSGVGKTKYIPPIDGKQTVDKFTVSLDLTNINDVRAHIYKELTGYDAISLQVVYDLVEDENQKEIRESFVKYIDEDMTLDDVIIENANPEMAGLKPLTIEANFSSSIFIQKAGKNYLVNVGKMIGPQSELYQEEERQLPVNQSNEKTYDRTLIITVPNGYEIANLDKLNMNVQMDVDEKKDMGFVSSYSLEGNKLTVKCLEYYYTLSYPIEKYENFEKVINAAADFNKIAVLLTKKK